MIREVEYNGQIIKYELIRKRVKNINLRVRTDGTVTVSANQRVSMKYIDSFVLSKAEFVIKAVESCKNRIETKSEYKIDRPRIKFRKMKSRWGSCNFVKCVITLNTNLIYCTEEMIYYVIVHEFSHLVVPNHSKDFYKVVERFCPDYKRIRKAMGDVII